MESRFRLPAAFRGVTANRPSCIRVSRHGLLAYASLFDTIGPFCNTVSNAGLLLQVAGQDTFDATGVDKKVPSNTDYLTDTSLPGVITGALGDGADGDIVSAFRSAVDHLTGLGAIV